MSTVFLTGIPTKNPRFLLPPGAPTFITKGVHPFFLEGPWGPLQVITVDVKLENKNATLEAL